MNPRRIGEIRMLCCEAVPEGWAHCDGTLLEIDSYPELFSKLGTSYGGDGKSTFALPDLRGRTPIGSGNGRRLGQAGGVERVALTTRELPAHSHPLMASGERARDLLPGGNLLAVVPRAIYGPPTDLTEISPGSVAPVGGDDAHENRQPFLAVPFIIAVGKRTDARHRSKSQN